MELFLLRHGNTFEKTDTPVYIGQNTDFNLTQTGLEQAANFAKYISSLYSHDDLAKFNLFHGKLKRHTQTVEILKKHFSPAQVIKTSALNELAYGKWERLTTEQITQKWQAEYSAWEKNSTWPAGIFDKSEEYYLAALSEWLLSIDKPSIAVTSNGILRLIYKLIQPNSISIEKVKTGNFVKLKLPANFENRENLTQDLTKIEIIDWNVNPQDC